MTDAPPAPSTPTRPESDGPRRHPDAAAAARHAGPGADPPRPAGGRDRRTERRRPAPTRPAPSRPQRRPPPLRAAPAPHRRRPRHPAPPAAPRPAAPRPTPPPRAPPPGRHRTERHRRRRHGTAGDPPTSTTPTDTAAARNRPAAPAEPTGPSRRRAPTEPPAWTEPPAATAPAEPTTPSPPGSPQAWTEPPAVTPGPISRNGAAAPPEAAPSTPAPRTTERIEPAEGRLERLRGRLARSRSGFGQGLLGLLGAGELDEDSWEDVEATLLQADLGPEMTIEITGKLRTELARRAVRTPEQVRQLLHDVLSEALRPELDRSVRALPHDGRPGVLLVVGVNGTGKTTTTGKLARVLVAGGRHVVLGAADTFRAAAAEQLTTWGERAGATVVRGPEGADPASVAFDAVKQGAEEGADVVLLDTAGRLHTKTGLMDELGKVKRVVERQAEVDEVLLVLDATTGQNGLTQARVFGDVVKVTGIVLTKLDGTAKGGIVFRVQRELGVPVKLVGLGEGADDLAPFVPAAFVDALLD